MDYRYNINIINIYVDSEVVIVRFRRSSTKYGSCVISVEIDAQMQHLILGVEP
jgi:hypothetical protein